MRHVAPNYNTDRIEPAYKDRITRLAASILVMASRYSEGRSIFPAAMANYADVYDNDPGESPPMGDDPGDSPPGLYKDRDFDEAYRPEKPDPQPYGPLFDDD